MQFSRQNIYNKQLEVEIGEVLIDSDIRNIAEEDINLLSQFIKVIGEEVDREISQFKLIIPDVFYKYVKSMDPELTKNIVIKIDVASDDHDSIAQMHDIDSNEFRLAVDIKDKKIIDKLPLNTEFVIIDRSFVHLLNDNLKKLRTNYSCIVKSVNGYSQLEEVKKLGVEYYSGEFIEKPEKIKLEKISPNKTSILSLMSALSDNDVELDDISKLISADSMLSFKILKIINSPIYRGTNELKSIQEAIVRFGFMNLKKWVMMLSLISLGDKPNALIRLALQRAVMCSKLATHIKIDSPDPYYTAGLFSMLDAFLDNSIDILLSEINISHEIINGILKSEGTVGKVLNIVKKYQHGDVSFNDSALTKIFIESGIETNEIMKAIGV